MRCHKVFNQKGHRWLVFGQDTTRPESIVDTNQIAICTESSTILLDPGGMEIFPSVISALVHEIDMDSVHHIFLSHQDPDIGSALSLWRRVSARGVSIHVPGLWESYIAHFDANARMTPIPDEGNVLALSPNVSLEFLPAHYMHSSAAFCVYDPKARILFSGDIGAALVPPDKVRDIWVHDFTDHVQYMAGFHRRYLGSPEARDAWLEMVRRLPIDIMIPQHGLAFRGNDVQRFFDWLGGLEIGTGVAAYRNRSIRPR